MSVNRSAIKLRIKDILRERNISNKQLAEMAGKSPQYISSALNNPKSLSLNLLVTISKALGVEFGDLFVSSFTPESPSKSDFNAVVTCAKGIFYAHNTKELQELANSLGSNNADCIDLFKSTLERQLRFPASADRRIVSELMANLARCMDTKEWQTYYRNTLAMLLPRTFEIDWHHLGGFMTQSELEQFESRL